MSNRNWTKPKQKLEPNRYFSFEPELNRTKIFAAILELNQNETDQKYNANRFGKGCSAFFKVKN